MEALPRLDSFADNWPAAAIRGVSILNVYSEYGSEVDQRRATNLIAGNGLLGDYHAALAPRQTMPADARRHRQ